MACPRKGKKASKLSVGTSVSKTVSKVKATYKINKLGKNAFKGAKAKKVTLGKTIKSIRQVHSRTARSFLNLH